MKTVAIITGIAVAIILAASAFFFFKCPLPSPLPPSPHDLPTIKLPNEIKGSVGEPVVIKSETNGRVVKWFTLDKNVKIFPSELLKDSKIAVAIAIAPGKYRVVAYTALNDTPSEVALANLIIAGNPGPDPDPDPEPNPPDPPPNPPDPWVKLFQAALDKEDSASKAKIKTLATIYKNAKKIVNQEDLKTVFQVRGAISSEISEKVGTDHLKQVRRAIATELNKLLPTDPNQVLNADTRLSLTRAFDRVGLALAALK